MMKLKFINFFVELKKIEGCNKKIMKLTIAEIINANPTKNFNFKKV